MQVLFFGFGYSSKASAEALESIAPSAVLLGTSRTPGSPQSVFFDGTSPSQALSEFLANSATHVVGSIGPDADGDPSLRHHRDDILNAPDVKWLGYFSTVGVYGDRNGAWVDETAPLEPENLRSQWRVAAEAEWQSLAAEKNVPLFILRLAGIYGPGRSAFDKLRDGTAKRIIKPGQVFNRIHVADIGRVTALAAERGLGGVFNLADDEPAPPQDVITHAAAMMDLPAPQEVPFELANMSPMARSFYADNKRVANSAIKQALQIELLYPNFRVGLESILESER
ncbi:SDR family oxidoreductase [Devosia sp. WQ 349]|uniref:SDR family oxidoreductase n=1 Tax=Devosia sp. WQ 349K1 TaxID=2800329 RepID=UPI001905ACE2|nr:SDR family oxidoreductase [Devosia sp. WQ 349K1]MBK1795180.1 SDR family oxidoreductase [Devosia sp. WQ 349K1]